MRRWLADAGIRRCTHCDEWKTEVGRNRLCKPCNRAAWREHYNALKAGRSRRPTSGDWGAKANAYFASQVDKDYYTDLRLRQASSLGRIA